MGEGESVGHAQGFLLREIIWDKPRNGNGPVLPPEHRANKKADSAQREDVSR
jgi:hypothetical protein